MSKEKVSMVISTVDEMSYIFEKTREGIRQIILNFEKKRTFTIEEGETIMIFNPDNIVSIHIDYNKEDTDNE